LSRRSFFNELSGVELEHKVAENVKECSVFALESRYCDLVSDEIIFTHAVQTITVQNYHLNTRFEYILFNGRPIIKLQYVKTYVCSSKKINIPKR
jgi:hypothetical protein